MEVNISMLTDEELQNLKDDVAVLVAYKEGDVALIKDQKSSRCCTKIFLEEFKKVTTSNLSEFLDISEEFCRRYKCSLAAVLVAISIIIVKFV